MTPVHRSRKCVEKATRHDRERANTPLTRPCRSPVDRRGASGTSGAQGRADIFGIGAVRREKSSLACGGRDKSPLRLSPSSMARKRRSGTHEHNIMKTNKHLSITVFFALVFAAACTAQNDSDSESSPDDGHAAPSNHLFASNDALDLTFEASFAKVFKDSNVGPGSNLLLPVTKEYFPMVTKYEDPQQMPMSVAGKFRIRGERTVRLCAFPKIRVKIAKEALPGAPLFQGASELNIGTHCDDKDDIDPYGKILNEKSSYRESFVYRLFHVLGIPGQMSRPLRATYVDPVAGTSITRQSFVFESIDTMAARVNGKALESDTGEFTSEQWARIDRKQAAKVYLFEVLAGNWDYSIYGGNNGGTLYVHNVEIVELPDGRLLPIANDFDISTMVNARISISDPTGGMEFIEPTKEASDADISKSLSSLGDFGVTTDEVREAAASFVEKKDAMLAELSPYPMDNEGKALIKLRIESFFDVITGY